MSIANLTAVQYHSFIHFWHAPLWVRSAKHRHHSLDWTILSHVQYDRLKMTELQTTEVLTLKASAAIADRQ